eukprot:499801-Rhodomonas_salina.1
MCEVEEAADVVVVVAVVRNGHLDLLARIVCRVREKEITVDVVVAFDRVGTARNDGCSRVLPRVWVNVPVRGEVEDELVVCQAPRELAVLQRRELRRRGNVGTVGPQLLLLLLVVGDTVNLVLVDRWRCLRRHGG